MKENDDTFSQAAQLERWQRLARFAEAQWQWFEDAYRALVQDLLHNQDHPEGPARPIDLAAALGKFSGPPAAAAPDTQPTKWAWWLEGDDRSHIEATESDCHGAAHDSIDSDTEPGIECEYFIARTTHPLDTIAHDNLAHWLGEFIHEDIDLRCSDETGAEEESLSITKEDKAELGQLVLNFLRARAKVQWFGIDKKTKARHMYVAGSDDEEAGGVPA